MRQKKNSSVILAILILIGLQTQAQDFNITGSGARAEGLGGAFIGLADDATAVLWNPGGLTQLEKMEASVVARSSSQKVDAGGSSSTSSNFALNFASFALPMKMGESNVVFALAFQRQLDMNEKLDLSAFSYTAELTGGVNTITPAAAIRLSPLLSVGLAANIWSGSYTFKQTLSGSTSSADITLSGFNMVIGGMLDLSGLQKPVPLKIGVSVKTPFSLKSESGGTSGTDDMPLMLGFGASYQASDNLVFAADYETRAYKKPISDSDKGLDQIRVGGEYLIVLKSSVIPIRLGFHTVPTTLADVDASGNSTSNQVNGTGFSVGTGYIAGKFAIDVSYTSDSYEQKYGTSSLKYADGKVSASLIFYLQ
jgi:hypothetical protein